MAAPRRAGLALGLIWVLVVAACGTGRPIAASSSKPTTSLTTPSTTATPIGSSTVGPGSSPTTGPHHPPITAQSPPSSALGHRTSTASPYPSSTQAPTPPVHTGAYGLVTAGPVCPVEQIGHPCPPKPLSAVEVSALDPGGQTIASTRTDNAGYYAVTLAPGDYTIEVVINGRWPRCPTTKVTVPPGQVKVDIVCDTGIR
jgi:Carboxypeptidase regulatory-like domain